MEFNHMRLLLGVNTQVFVDKINIDDELKAVEDQPHQDIHWKARLLYKNWLVLLASSDIIPMLLHEFHNNSIGGHNGVFKTYQRIARELYWKEMKSWVRSYVTDYTVCQEAKYLTLAPGSLL